MSENQVSGPAAAGDVAEANESEAQFQVVRNEEGQYSVWPVERDVPAGWSASGPRAAKAECLAYIKEHWSDIRPLSLQRRLNGAVE